MDAAGEMQLFDLNAHVQRGDEDLQRREVVNGTATNNQLRKKQPRCHRHNPYQIYRMEAAFKECPHPSKQERVLISEELGLEPMQVKFWFQNKRTQMKSKNEQVKMGNMRAEIERLKNENKTYKDALSSAVCVSCGSVDDDRHLRMENVTLKNEIEKISAIAAKLIGREQVD